MTKKCGDCEKVKSTTEFMSSQKNKDGLYSYCRACVSIRSREWRDKNIEYCRAIGREYYKNNRTTIAEKSAAYRAANKEKRRISSKRYYQQNREKMLAVGRGIHLKNNFGITVEQYDLMLIAQLGVCRICDCIDPVRRLAVDHDHATGEIRGLLCGSCNTVLGKMKDSPALLRKAAEYIEKKGKL